MDAKTELNKVWKDLQAATREFATWGIEYGQKAIEKSGVGLKKVEEHLKRAAEKLKKEGELNAEPAAKTETSAPTDTTKQ
jgi:hypothetical protein